MKSVLVLLSALVVFSYCKKDDASCKIYKNKEGQEVLLDTNAIEVTEFRSILHQYPELQVYQLNNNSYTWSMKCHVFYKGLPVFTDYYYVIKNKASGEVTTYDTLRPISLPSLDPGITATDAIREAKRHVNFDHTCISYRLGIYNVNAGVSYAPINYKLVWKVQGEKEYPYVILDAYTKEMYVRDNGIIIN